MARKNAKARKRAAPMPIEVIMEPTPEQVAKGNVKPAYVVHVDSWTTTKAHRVSNVLEQWFERGEPGFNEGARAAIEWCQVRWEAWDVIDTWPLEQRIGFYRGNALKYVMRAGSKGPAAEDIAKASHYLQKLSEVLLNAARD